jgi:glucose/arabinose dehydrogenase
VLTPVVSGLDQPVAFAVRPGDDTRHVAERPGRVRRLDDETVVADLSDRTSAGGERGLLGIAFSPDGQRLYVSYTDLDGTSIVDELTMRPDGTADPATRRQVLAQRQPYANHNGGQISFGPDGYLYLALGDGGSALDPERAGLDLTTWLGKLLRIDPSGPDGYSVPEDNPFAGSDGVEPEIWSYGLRNPWRFSWDSATGDLWIADVGQNRREEINRSTRAEGAGRATNYGWSAWEGTLRANDDQDPEGATPPVHEYDTGEEGCAVTGGYVYRGSAIPELQGAYVFGDYCQAGLRAIPAGAFPGTAVERRLTDEPGEVVSFGEDASGELYVLSFDGTVYRIDPA